MPYYNCWDIVSTGGILNGGTGMITPEQAQADYMANYKPTTLETIGAYTSDMWWNLPIQSFYEYGQEQYAHYTGEILNLDDQRDYLDSKGMAEHLQPRDGYTREQLDVLIDMKQRENRNAWIKEQNDSIIASALGWGASIPLGFTDPLNYIGLPGGAANSLLRKYGTSRGRYILTKALSNAASATIGNIAAEAVVNPIRRSQQQNYTIWDSLATVSIGAVLAGGLGALGARGKGQSGWESFNNRTFAEIADRDYADVLRVFQDSGTKNVTIDGRVVPAEDVAKGIAIQRQAHLREMVSKTNTAANILDERYPVEFRIGTQSTIDDAFRRFAMGMQESRDQLARRLYQFNALDLEGRVSLDPINEDAVSAMLARDTGVTISDYPSNNREFLAYLFGGDLDTRVSAEDLRYLEPDDVAELARRFDLSENDVANGVTPNELLQRVERASPAIEVAAVPELQTRIDYRIGADGNITQGVQDVEGRYQAITEPIEADGEYRFPRENQIKNDIRTEIGAAKDDKIFIHRKPGEEFYTVYRGDKNARGYKSAEEVAGLKVFAVDDSPELQNREKQYALLRDTQPGATAPEQLTVRSYADANKISVAEAARRLEAEGYVVPRGEAQANGRRGRVKATEPITGKITPESQRVETVSVDSAATPRDDTSLVWNRLIERWDELQDVDQGLRMEAARPLFSDLSREQLDQALIALQRSGEIVVYPYDQISRITPAAREAALTVNGRPLHVIYRTGKVAPEAPTRSGVINQSIADATQAIGQAIEEVAPAVGPAAREVGDAIDAAASEVARTTIPESFDALVGEVVETVGQAVNNEAIGEAVDTIARDVSAAVDAVAVNPAVRQEVENIRYEVARIIDTLGQQRQVENLGWTRSEPPIVSNTPLPEERLATLRRQFERIAANEQRQRSMLAQADTAARAVQDPETRAIITPPAEMPSNITRAVTMIAADDPDLAEALATAQFYPDARVSVSQLTQTYGFADDKATRAWLNKMGYDETVVPKKNNTVFTIAELERQRGYRANLVDPDARIREGVVSIDMINRDAVTTMDALGDVVGGKGRAYLEANGYNKAVFPKTNTAEFRLADLDNAMANRRLLASIDEAIALRGDFSRVLVDSDLLIGGQTAVQPTRDGIVLPGAVEPAAEPIRLITPGQPEPMAEAPRLWTPESEAPRSAGPIVSQSGVPLEGWRAPRGMIDFEEGGKAIISFFNSADPTTGHHELFHWYRRMLADIAGDPAASPETRQSYRNLCDYVGAKPGEAWTREMDEKFAHTATDYLFGKPQPLPDTIREPLADLRDYVQNLYALAKDNNIPISGPMHNAFATLRDTQQAEADIEQMRVASEFENRAPESEFAAIHEVATPRAEANKLAATPLETRVEAQGAQADRLLADIQRSFETDTQATRMLQNDYRVFMDNLAQHDAEISRLTALQQDPTVAASIVNEARGGESRLFQDILTPEEQASLVGTAVKQLEDGVAPDAVTENIAKTISNAVTNAVDARSKDIVNFNAVKNAVDYIMTNSPDKMADGLYGMLGGSRYVRQGARISVESLKQSMQSQLQSAFKVRIERELGPEVLKMFVKDKIPQEQLMAAVWSLSDKNYKYTGSQEALGVAKIYKDLLDQAFARTERTGMTMGNIDNYFIRQTHDQELIFKAGKEKYKDIARQTFDWDKIDGGRYIEDLEGRERFMDGCYSTLSTGYHYVFDGDIAPASGLRGWENTGTPHERLIQFRSPEAWSQYHTLFGVGSARAGMISSLNRLANLSAMTQVLGVDSKGNLNRIVDTLMNHLRSLDTPDALRQMRELESYMKEGMGSGRITRLMSVLDGSVNTAGAGSQIVADVMSKYRSWKVMCNLGSALLSQLGDFVSSIREMQYQGDSLWKAIWGEIDNWTRRYGLDERQVASELGVYCDGMAADFVNSKYLVEGQKKGTFAKLQEAFTSVMGVEQYDNAHRRNMTMAMSHNLASEAHLDFNNLSKRRQRVISLYMSPAEWNLIRQGGNEIANGRAYFTPQAADGIADASIARHLDSLGMPASKTDIDAFRGQLKEKMSAYFWDRGRYAVLNPDAVTQAWTTWGAPRGTFVGEGMRLAMQYKSFTTSFMQRTLSREMYGYGADSIGAAIRDLVVGRMEQGEGRGLGYLIGGGAVFGILSSQLKQVSRGAMPRDLTDPNTWLAGIAQSGGLGFISDALFADYNRYGGSNLLSLLGPAASDAESLYNIYLSGVNGELRQQRIWSNVFGNIPFNNHFAVRAALNNLLFAPLRDMFQEDYIKDTIRKMEKRAKPGGEEPRMGGQAYWWAPGHLPFQSYN